MSSRASGRVVAQDDQARLVAAAAADGGQGAHAELVELLRREDLARQVLVLGGELLRLLAERVRSELVRRHVREVARAVRSLGDDRGALDGRLQLGIVGVTDHDPLRRACLVVRLPAAGRVRAEDRSFDERRRLLGQRHRQRLVEQPDERPADAGERLRGGCGRRSQCVCVDLLALPDPRRDEAGRLELAVQMEKDGLAAVAAQVAALAELPEPPAELVVDDLRSVSARRLGYRKCKRIRSRLPRKGDLDLRHGSRWYRCGAYRRA